LGLQRLGRKYPPFDLDNAVPGRIAKWSGRRRFTPGIILEGGAIDSKRCGAILHNGTVSAESKRIRSWIAPDMNDIWQTFSARQSAVGSAKESKATIPMGTSTNWSLRRPTHCCAAREDDPTDANYKPLRENFERLKKNDRSGCRSPEVIRSPIATGNFLRGPTPAGQYCNFYMANGGVAIVPQFDDPADSRAIEILARLLPDRGNYRPTCARLVWGSGAFHCITQAGTGDSRTFSAPTNIAPGPPESSWPVRERAMADLAGPPTVLKF